MKPTLLSCPGSLFLNKKADRKSVKFQELFLVSQSLKFVIFLIFLTFLA